MRRLLFLSALLAAATVVGSAWASTPRGLPDCLGKPAVRPHQVIFACGDANFGFDRLQWLAWGGTRAVGIGSAYLNDCTPYCAAGHFHRYPAVLIASGSPRCPDGSTAYRLVTYAFIGRSPFSVDSSATRNPRQTFRCGSP